MNRMFIRLATAVFFIGLTACSGAPDKGDGRPVPSTTEKEEAPTGPLEVAESWLDSDEPPPAIRAIVGETPLVERIWREGEFYRAVVVDPAGPAADGEGDAVLLTLERDGESWKVSVAEPGPASTLWPSL